MRTSALAGRLGLGFLAFVGIGPLLAPSHAAAQSCMVTTPIGPINDVGTAVAIQPDGKILLSGYASNGVDDDFAIVRYNPDFTLDLSFGTGGKVTTPIGGAQDRSEAIALQSDGKIVVAGHKNSGGGNNDFAVVRYNIDGTLDTTFNPGGAFGGPPNLAGMVVTAITGGDDEIEGLAIQSDGKIVVAGFSQRATLDYVAARYNTDGSLDTAGFNSPNGYYISTNGATNDVANAVAIQPSDGKIVLSGWAHSGVNEDFAIVRLNTDGTFDGAFGTVLVNFLPNNRDRAHTVIIQPADDKILVAGEVRNGSGLAMFGAARRNPDGSADATFGTGGMVTTDFTAAHDVPLGMALQTDGHIVLGGYTNWTGAGTSVDFGLLRYDDLGNADNTFDVDSKVTTDIAGDNDWLDALALQSNGKIIAGGYSKIANNDFTLVRYNVDGSIDNSCVTTTYRSIGTNGGVLDNVGNASITAGTNIVTFAGGASLPVPTAVGAVGVGDVLILDPGPSQEITYIRSRDSDTRVTLQTGAMGTHTNVSYEIRRAYTTLQAWEEARDGLLVAENRREVGVTYKDGPFIPPYAIVNAALLIDGSITDADRYMWLTVATGQRHGGIAGAGVVVDGQGATMFGILDQDDYTRIDGPELVRFKKAGAAGFASIVTEATGALYQNLLIHDFLEPTVVGEGVRVSIPTGGSSFTLRNSIIYNGDRSGVRIDEATSDITVENCTIYNMENWGVSIGSAGGTATVSNTISMNHGTASFDAGSGTLSQTFNISSDGTAAGGGSLTNRTATDNAFPGVGDWVIFESLSAPEDLHLQNSAENDALNGADDLSANFWRDIDTQSRFGVSWDYGADELVCQIYYTDEGSPNRIERVDLDGSRQTTLVTIPPAGVTPRGIVLDVAGGKMYWAEGGTKIRRANLDGSNVQDLVTGLTTPRDIDLDLAAGKMYWTDSGTNRIQRANLDGTGVQNILGGLSTPRAGPVLDLTAGKMYWTEDGANRIRRANLDGTGVQNLVTTGLSGPFGIALDIGAGKMYWTDYLNDKIQRANLDGTGVQDLVTTGLLAPRGIALDLGAGKMYWVDYGSSKLQRANLDGTSVEDVLTNLGAPNGVALGCNISANLVPTAVELTAFTATGADSAVVLEWETGAEMNNLGFHLYRAERAEGPYERVTANLIPGLGSSPAGASYRHVDSGLVNGVTYYYELEDVETTGRTDRHGPVSATPSEGHPPPDDDTPSSLITIGDPASNAFEVLRRRGNEVVVTLRTEGFYAEPQDDGTVKITIPDFEDVVEPGAPGIPVERRWIEAIAGRKVKLLSVRASDVEVFESLRPSGSDLSEVRVSSQGTIRASQRSRAFVSGDDLYPHEPAHIVEVAFQGDVKKALLQLAPLRWDPSTGRLMLARRLVVRLAFRGRERNEVSADGVRGRRVRKVRQGERTVLARLVTETPGLHAVRYEELFGRKRARGYSVALSRGGRPVAFHLEPDHKRFGPGTTLYFLSDGARANPNGNHAVYELELGEGVRMQRERAAPSGPTVPYAWRRVEKEENRIYQPTLLDAPDRWLWDALFAPVRKSYPFQVTALAPVVEDAQLHVWLQGTTDLPASPDHHVRLVLNGTFVDEVFLDGKQSAKFEAAFPSSLLKEGENVLEVENVGDTEAAYSMVMLNKFALVYPAETEAHNGVIEARWSESGTAAIAGATHVVDVTNADPIWLTEAYVVDGRLRFRAEAGRSYLAVGPEAVLRPTVQPVTKTTLRTRRQADYLLIGPEAFIEAAQPLVAHRTAEGLSVRAVSVEDIVSEFGFGEHGPHAIREFIAYAYHHWREPSLKYVLLIGDATYDPKDLLGTGTINHVPSPSIRTSFLWTASDPVYAAVNGDDQLPDIAIGRLPASSVQEVREMVSKILAYENAARSLRERIVLVADDPDEAGDFVAHAEELLRTILSGTNTETIYLSTLGIAETKRAIVNAFDEGSSLMSYLGHGAIHLWAGEAILANRDIASLSPQQRQPLLLTMNCLNGYFHFPYFDSLSEELLKRSDRGIVAAFSPSGLSLDAPAHRYHAALLEALLEGGHERLGDAVLAAQEAYADTGAFPELLSIYHLLGDPALTLR